MKIVECFDEKSRINLIYYTTEITRSKSVIVGKFVPSYCAYRLMEEIRTGQKSGLDTLMYFDYKYGSLKGLQSIRRSRPN